MSKEILTAKELWDNMQAMELDPEAQEVRELITPDDLLVGWLIATQKYVEMGILTEQERHELTLLAARETSKFRARREE